MIIKMKIIDLSTLIYTDMEIFPGDPDVKINLVHTYKKNSWELRQLSMGSHTGTHVDAFSHMHEGKESLDKIPIERFCGKGQVVDPSDHWPTDIGLFFIEEIGIEYLERLIIVNPGFVGGNITEELERALLGKNIITYTRLINLELLPPKKSFMFYGLPLKIKEGDGSPVRAIAILEDE